MSIRAASKAHAGPGERTQQARLPAGIASVLSVLSSSAVVLDSEDRVLTAEIFPDSDTARPMDGLLA